MLAQALSEGDIPLHDVVERALEKSAGPNRLLLLVDQFEELYTLCPQPETRRRFVDALLAAVEAVEGKRGSPFVLLLTMRADFMGQALAHRPFADVLQESSLMLGPMTREELRTAIERPAEKQGAALEAGLVERLLDDVGEEPGNLPLLEFALTLLWERLDYGWMTHRAYEEIGRVEGALARYAEEVYEGLEEGERERARRIFTQLVQPGEETADTRRVATRAELGEGNWPLVQHLADRRLVVTGRDEPTGRETVEVVHEALIQRWGQLRGWMEKNQAFRTWQERLRGALSQWQATERDEGVLLRGAPLAEADGWLAERGDEVSPRERAFIEASVELRERQAAEWERRRQRIIVGLAAGLVIALILALVAVRQRQTALANLNRSEAQRLAAEASRLLLKGSDSEVAALLAIRSLSYQYTPQGDEALVGAAVLQYPLRIFTGHTGSVRGVTFSPDGKTIVTGSDDGTPRLWDVDTGEEIRRFTGHTGPVYIVTFSPDGHYIVSSSADKTARLWEVDTGEEIRQFVHTADVWDIALSPDGHYLLTSGLWEEGTARLWDIATGEEVRAFTGHAGFAWAVAFSPDGRYALTGSADATVRLWDVATGEHLKTFSGHTDGVFAVAFSPDGRSILTGSLDKTARLWDIDTAEELHRLSHSDILHPWGVAFSPDGRYLLTGGMDNSAHLWDAATGAELRRFSHTATVGGLAFSPDGRYVATGSWDREARLWETEPTSELPQFPRQDSGVWDVAFSPDGRTVLADLWDNTTRLWDARTGAELQVFTGQTGSYGAVAFSPDGRYVAGSSRVWDARTGAELYALAEESDNSIIDVAFSPDGRYLLVGFSWDHVARLWDVTAERQVQTFTPEAEVACVAYSPDGATVLTGLCSPPKVYLWDAATSDKVREFAFPEDAVCAEDVAFSPDGRAVLAGDRTGRLWMWDAVTGEKIREFSGHTDRIWCAVFSPDGRFALSGGGDRTARLWDVSTGIELRRLAGHASNVWGVAFSPDGRIIVTSGADGTARLWYTDLNDTMDNLCGRLPRDFTEEEREQYDIADDEPTCPNVAPKP